MFRTSKNKFQFFKPMLPTYGFNYKNSVYLVKPFGQLQRAFLNGLIRSVTVTKLSTEQCFPLYALNAL